VSGPEGKELDRDGLVYNQLVGGWLNRDRLIDDRPRELR